MLSLATSQLAQRLVAFARASLRAVAQDSDTYAGRWVALDQCRYEEGNEAPTEGRVVDSDPDLGELCSRLRNGSRHRCVIVRADEGYRKAGDTNEPKLRRTSSPLSPAA